MIRAELIKLYTRPRTWLTLALLSGLPVIVGIFVKATCVGPRPGQGPALLSEVRSNGLLFPAAALALVIPIFLPVATAVISGDAIAGEAAQGTLRYLLIRPVSRSRLLFAKLLSVIAFVITAVLVVAAIGFAAGYFIFGFEPLASLSGGTLTQTDTVGRTLIAMGYVAMSMLGIASIALFASTRTASPLSAALAALATFVISQVLDLIEATRAIKPYLPTHYWLSFIDLYREPILWHNVTRGLALQLVYTLIFTGAAWAHFATKDVT